MKIEKSLGQQKPSRKDHALEAGADESNLGYCHQKLSKNQGKSMMIALTCADANAFMKKHCPACLINGMFKKIQAFPGLNPVTENIFMLQMKGSELIACANLKALQQHLAIFCIKVQFLKSQVKRSSRVESLHNYSGIWSWYLFQGFYGTCFLLQTSLVVSCLRCNGCPEKGALQLVQCIHQHEPSPSTYKYLPKWVTTTAQNLQRHLKWCCDECTVIQSALYVVIFLVHLQML